MNNHRGAQSRAKIGRLSCQIAHPLIKGKIEPRFDEIICPRRRLKCLCRRKPRRHCLDMQVVIFIDKDANPHIRTDVRHAVRLVGSELLTDELLPDQDLPLNIRQFIDDDALKGLSECRAKIRKDIIQNPLYLCQLCIISTPRKRKPHQIARKTYAARQHNITVLSGGTKPRKLFRTQEILKCHGRSPPYAAPMHESDRAALPPSRTPHWQLLP